MAQIASTDMVYKKTVAPGPADVSMKAYFINGVTSADVFNPTKSAVVGVGNTLSSIWWCRAINVEDGTEGVVCTISSSIITFSGIAADKNVCVLVAGTV